MEGGGDFLSVYVDSSVESGGLASIASEDICIFLIRHG
jgi:hypothetical protein